MSEDTLLSALCGICHAEKPKYRCPGCMAQTCSLTCYKKHQQRAPCSGKRNPAKYVKKSELVTPAGFDHDYNYLKGVEAEIGRAAANIEQRGIGSSSTSTATAVANKNVLRGRHHNSALQKYLVQNRIHVEQAPVGMHRQSVNQTRPTKRNNIFWTVEWTDAAGAKTLQHHCAESTSIAALYDAHLAEKRPPAAAPDARGIKRKRQEITASDAGVAETLPDGTTDETRGASPTASVATSVTLEADDAQTEFAPTLTPAPTSTPSVAPTSSSTAKSIGTAPTTAIPPPDERQFYLVRPSTAARKPVLIHIATPRETSLTQVLRDRTVLEFPTFVVLSSSHGPEALPDTYMLEAAYESRRRVNNGKAPTTATASTNTSDVQTDAVVAAAAPPRQGSTKEVDAQSILDMLKRDGFS